MTERYYYMYKGKKVDFIIEPDYQIAAQVHKESNKWLDSDCHETAWQILSPNAFKIYDKFARQANDYVWVYHYDIFGMSISEFENAVNELEEKGFFVQVTKTNEETGEVLAFPSVYHFYERPRMKTIKGKRY